jgi:hypothetical protein
MQLTDEIDPSFREVPPPHPARGMRGVELLYSAISSGVWISIAMNEHLREKAAGGAWRMPC